MTTVLADRHAGVMVADTGAGDGDRQWPGARKVWRVGGALIGFAGEFGEIESFLAWLRGGPLPRFTHSHALALSPEGLFMYSGSTSPVSVPSGRDAIGTGAKAAIAAYDALGWQNPRRAVQIACRYDAQSRAPVRHYWI